ncbi:MAG: YjjG family noncanonical pyrimidine nucleotidase [Chloroflexota bacterium]
MTYRVLLFDADGTLFDYEKAEAHALQRTFQAYGLPWRPDYLALYREINTGLWALLEQGHIRAQAINGERFGQLLQSIAVQIPAADFSRDYLIHLGNCAELIEGADETIAALASRYHLAILTNGLKDVQRSRLAHSPIQPYISELIISEEVGAAKPDAAIFAAAFERLGNPGKPEVLMIGDSLSSDIRGAAGFGIDACWYNPLSSPRPAGLPIAYEIGRLEELLVLLG